MGFREDIRAVPDDVRTVMRDVEGSLEEKAEERPIVRYMLDLRIVLVAALGAFVIALILMLIGLGFIFSLIVFLLLLIGLWLVIAGAAAPRRPTTRARVREGAQPGARRD
jgi:uncharacterized protein (DUF58 family)